MIREWRNSLRQQKSTSTRKVEVLTYILSYKVGIKADIKAVMTECKADLKCEIFLEAVNHIRLEAWVVVAIIVLVLIYEKLVFTPLIYINATLLGFKKLGI